jgi:antitoxin ParD1/3/4
METMNIALSAEMKEFVRGEVERGGYSSASEYVRALIREEQKRKAQDVLEGLLIEGLESGPATPMGHKEWEELKQRLLERQANKQAGI